MYPIWNSAFAGFDQHCRQDRETSLLTLTSSSIDIRSVLVKSALCLWAISFSVVAPACDVSIAHAVSIQGRVEVQSPGTKRWEPVLTNDLFCPGDRVRVNANSRAGLYLNNGTLLRLKERSTLLFQLPQKHPSYWVELLRGGAHFIDHVKKPIRVNTPYVNAAIEGTEFTVEVDESSAKVTVLEGQVRAYNAQGGVRVSNGEQVVSLGGQVPVAGRVVNPIDAVQWVLYYPAIFTLSHHHQVHGVTAKRVIGTAQKAYWQGDIEKAIAALSKVQESGLLVIRASLYLQVGRVEAAQSDLNSVLDVHPSNGSALALKSLISTVRNEHQAAMDYAEQAVQAEPDKAATHLALSYARQAIFQLSQALSSARQAVVVDAENALAWSRLAQLHLMLHNMDEAINAAGHAAALDLTQPMTQTTLGFARLIQLDLLAARKAFNEATRLDQASPLPHLGLGLIHIREGELEKGRNKIEIAANLDPGNALIRSYLGKAYYEEKRSELAETQFELAKKFDELDPTAWFYDAIRKQTENRPLEALDDLQTAMALNDYRAVYRSRLQLDEDQASRSASLARIYEDLGYDRLALKESRRFLSADPSNPAAHRFLADSYIGVQYHETARLSEVLQAQLLTPEIVAPVSPSAGEMNLFSFEGSGPSLAGLNEYNPLFNRQRVSFLASGVTGSNNTRGEEVTVGGFTNRGMLSAGYFNVHSDGYRANNDYERSVNNLLGQFRINSELSVQGEVKHRNGEFGQLSEFITGAYDSEYREEIESDIYRVGLNYRPNIKNTILFSSIALQRDEEKRLSPEFVVKSDMDNAQHELQYMFHDEWLSSIAGIMHLDSDHSIDTFIFGYPSNKQINIKQNNAYLYFHVPWQNGLGIVGVDYMHMSKQENEGVATENTRKQYNPKFGLQWDLSDSTTLRMAAFRTFFGRVINGQTLVPTQVAGFNQLYDDSSLTSSWRYGVAIDSVIGERLHSGIEITRRTATRFSDNQRLPDREIENLQHVAYISLPLGKQIAFSGKYRYDSAEQEWQHSSTPAEEILSKSLSFQINYNNPNGLIASVDTSRVLQDVFLPGYPNLDEDSDYWIANSEIGYRLPKRLGMFKLRINNMFDREFNYQSGFPGSDTQLLPPYSMERTVFLHLQLWL
jgi:tetratricopeptide (TPR) repeat protein